MKVTVQKKHILPVLSKLQGITGRKSNLAITTHVLLSAEKKGISLSATDLETGFEGQYPAQVEQEGRTVLNSRKLFEIIKDFPSEEIILQQLDNQWIEIKKDQIEFHIVGMNPEDFPAIPRIEAELPMHLPSRELASMIQKTVIIPAASDDRRPHILGVYFEKLKEGSEIIFRMVSTDGSRLSKVDLPISPGEEAALERNVLVPKKSLVEVGKFLEGDKVAEVAFKENHMLLHRDGERLIVRLLEGEFPKYHDIIKISDGIKVKLERLNFLSVLRRMSILGSEEYKGVIFNFENDTLTVSSTNPDLGESKEVLSVQFPGKKMTIMFNPRFFIDSLNVMEDEAILLHLTGEDRPCILTGEKDRRYLSVLMPMRI
ncbi:MAG: DNA polymerase III subunit beta [Desulfobacterales bacterium]